MEHSLCESALCDALGIRRGLTAIIGAGGKTTLIRRLCAGLSGRGSVIVTTTTRIYPPDLPVIRAADADAVRAALQSHGTICVASDAENGKLKVPELSMDTLKELADYVLVEADGAKGFPLKAHAPHEPVIPACADAVIQVTGADGLFRPIASAAHRPELYADRLGADTAGIVTPEFAAAMLLPCDAAVINKADSYPYPAAALAKLLPYAVLTELEAQQPLINVWRNGECLY